MQVELYKKTKKTEIPVVTSLDIAETFEKEHKNVLQDIRNVECSKEFSRLNFQPTLYVDSFNRKQPMYYMTRDGFTFLVMGYKGAKAAAFKEAYIKQFNAMEKALKEKREVRLRGVDARKLLTDEIKNQGLTDTAYPAYTNLVYNHVFGMTAAELKHKRGLSKNDNLRDVLTPEELKAIDRAERLVSSLVGLGWHYVKINKFLETESR